MPLVKFLILICLLPFAMAEEHGGGEAVKPENAEYSGKQTQEWSEVQTKLAALKGKVDSQDSVVKALIVEKSTLTGDNQIQKIDQLKKEHQKWQVMVEEYNKLNSEYETRFPEKGLKENRVYRRIDPKSIERIENDMTLEGRLARLQKKVFKQYPKTSKQIELEKAQKQKIEDAKRVMRSNLMNSKKPDKNLSKPISGDVTEPIILKK